MNDTGNTSIQEIKSENSIRVVVLGKTGIGKSATCNTLVGEQKFNSKASTNTITTKCEHVSFIHENKSYLLIDTPGLFDTNKSDQELHKELENIMDIAQPGPHVFIILLSLNRFTNEERNAIEKISDIFGENVFKHSLILFTGLDYLEAENLTLNQFIKDSNQYIKELVNLCNGYYLGINNKEKDLEIMADFKKTIFKMINEIAERPTEFYKIETFNLAKEKYKEKLRKIELERNEEIKKLNELQREYDERINRARVDSDPVVQEIKRKWYNKLFRWR